MPDMKTLTVGDKTYTVHDEAARDFSGSTGILPVAKGGTGANDAAEARVNLGITLENLGAAPAGYGLGETSARLVTSLDEVISPGWYRKWFESDELPAGTANGVLVFYVGFYGGTNHLEIIMPVNHNYTDYSNLSLLKRRKRENGWQPWEWVNPPMIAGVEYRTTERFMGLPVYAYFLHYGYYDNSITSINHGISGMYIPLDIKIVNNEQEALTTSSGITNLTLSRTDIGINGAWPMGNVQFILKYTKF